MTSFLTGGVGSLNSTSTSTTSKALRDIDSQKVSYANKDFVKNISWLNNSVDTLAQYTQKLEQGVQSANSNALEQIQGFWGDLFILFGGFEPTGVDVGDVKYVIQGIGAFFGINPDTPFPLNLVEAAAHFFTTYIIPLDQFTDVVFDAIEAWGEELGLSPEFMESLESLRDAISALGVEFSDLFDALKELLGAFGFLGFTSTSGLGDLWDVIIDFIGNIGDITALKPVLSLLSTLGVPFINALTAIINGSSSFLGFISGDQVRQLGDNVVPAVANSTTVWTIGASSTLAWIWDGSQSALTTLGTTTDKRVLTQNGFAVTPGTKWALNGSLRWSGIPTGANDFGLAVVFYNGGTEVSQTNINIAGGHGASGGFTAIPATEITVPINVDTMKVGARIGTGYTSGQVWVKGITAQRTGQVPQNIVEGLVSTLASFLGVNSPLNALNIFGQIPTNLLGLLSISNLTNQQVNLLTAPTFDSDGNIEGGGIWSHDGAVGHTTAGSVKVTAASVLRELASNKIPVAEGDTIDFAVWLKWAGLTYTGVPIKFQAVRMLNNSVVGTDDLASPASPALNQAAWVQLTDSYTVPAGCNELYCKFYVASTATAGDIWWDDASAKKTGLLQIPWVDGLPDGLQLPLDQVADVLETIFGTLSLGGTITNPLLDFLGALGDLDDILSLIPGVNVLGVGGPSNIGATVQTTWDQWVSGLVGVLGTGAELSDLFNIGFDVASRAAKGQFSFDILGIRNNKNFSSGMLSTSRASLPLTQVVAGSSAPTFSITSSTAITLYERVNEAGAVGVVRWMGGSSLTNVTGFFLNIYKMDTTNGNRTCVYTSGDIKADLSGTMTTEKHVLSTPITQEAGEVYGYELALTGVGSHTVVGQASWVHADPDVYPQKMSSVRNGGSVSVSTTQANGTFTYGTNIPFMEFAVALDGVSIPHSPDLQTFATATTVSYPVPSWCNTIQPVGVGGGGGGHQGGTWGVSGRGADEGAWNATTWTRGVHFTGNPSLSITVPVAARGGGNSSYAGGGSGDPGGNVTITLGANVLTCTGGAGATAFSVGGADQTGDSPGNYTYDSVPYAGGGTQSNPGGKGSTPGGGGAGGNYISFQAGGDGALGRAWVRFKQ